MKHLSQYILEKYNSQPITEGGASGHMLHPYDVDEFTGYDIEDLIKTMFGGKMEGMTEKMDGFGMQASMNRDGEVVFIRNKGNLNSEKGGMTLSDFATQWAENPTALDNYTRGGKIIEAVFKKIGKDWFNPSESERKVVNCECILAGTTNTIPYVSDQVDFHNIWIYQWNGNEWVNTDVTKKGLDVVEKACEGIDNAKITPQVIIKYSEETEALEKKWLSNWQKFLKEYDCKPDITIEGIKYSLFFKWIKKNLPWLMDDHKAAMDVCRRWLFGDKKSVDLKNLKATYQDHLDEFNKIDKSPSKVINDILLPLQKFFYGMGADIIKITSGFANDNQDGTIKTLLGDLKVATDKIRREGSLEDNEFLQRWLDVLYEIGEENVRGVEGIVFNYKGKMMKWTGGFVPLNRIIGYSKYTMKPKTLVESLFDRDLVTKDIMYHPKNREELINCIEEQLNIQGPDANLNIIDVSEITNMSFLFLDFSNKIKNIDISKWDVSKVKFMDYIFYGCKNFNSDLSKWDVSNVKDINCMFYECTEFNSDLSKWDMSKVENMSYMFFDCKSFNSDLSKWNVENVKNMNSMFYGCKSLKKIPDWYEKS